MADTTDFIAYFSILADPRAERTKKYRLIDLLFIAVCMGVARTTPGYVPR